MSRSDNAARRAMFQSFGLPDEQSFGIYKELQKVYPAFAQKLFENNGLMQRLIMSGYNPMHMLDYPVCGRCETLAVYDGYAMSGGKRYDRCTCVREGCGASTTNPVTLRVWMRDELKKKVKPEFFETIEDAVDGIAAQMMLSHVKRMRYELERHNAEIMPKISHTEVDQGAKLDYKQTQVDIEHLGVTDSDPALPEDRIEIGDDLDAEQ